jgi:hypothetical protein
MSDTAHDTATDDYLIAWLFRNLQQYGLVAPVTSFSIDPIANQPGYSRIILTLRIRGERFGTSEIIQHALIDDPEWTRWFFRKLRHTIDTLTPPIMIPEDRTP